jgi:hypothetical protein
MSTLLFYVIADFVIGFRKCNLFQNNRCEKNTRSETSVQWKYANFCYW